MKKLIRLEIISGTMIQCLSQFENHDYGDVSGVRTIPANAVPMPTSA